MTFTREQIIAWAREAELHCHVKLTEHGLIIEDLQYFAALIEQATIERCAIEADCWQTALHDPRYECDCATAIRALKEQA